MKLRIMEANQVLMKNKENILPICKNNEILFEFCFLFGVFNQKNAKNKKKIAIWIVYPFLGVFRGSTLHNVSKTLSFIVS